MNVRWIVAASWLLAATALVYYLDQPAQAIPQMQVPSVPPITVTLSRRVLLTETSPPQTYAVFDYTLTYPAERTTPEDLTAVLRDLQRFEGVFSNEVRRPHTIIPSRVEKVTQCTACGENHTPSFPFFDDEGKPLKDGGARYCYNRQCKLYDELIGKDGGFLGRKAGDPKAPQKAEKPDG